MYLAMITALHGMAGLIALVTFWTAIAARKGSSLHIRAGQIYLVAIAVVLAAGFPMAIARFFRDQPVAGAFLSYLLVITATTSWASWRAIKDQGNWARYTGPVYKVLALLNAFCGAGMFWVGYDIASQGQGVIMGYGLVGLFIAWGMFRFAKAPPTDTRWWLKQHINNMMGNAIATHVAFLAIGLPKVIPQINGPVLQGLAWFGPMGVALLGGIYFTRKYLKPRVRPAALA